MDIRTKLKFIMKHNNRSMTYVSGGSGISKATISLWLNNNYKGDNDKITDKINNFIQREIEQSLNDRLPVVKISILKYIFEIGRLCHTSGSIGVCAGKAGLGKTVAVKEYTKIYLDSILIESDSGYTAKSLLKEIHKRLSLSGEGSVYDLMSEVVVKLNNSGRLMIIDEAENLPYRALEITRRIHDKAGVGVLLVGKNILFENLRGFNNQYDQLYSRVKYHKLLDKLLIQDVVKILESAGLDNQLAEDFLFYSNGNTRRLEQLISHSISLAKSNGKVTVDNTVIKNASRLLMD